MSDVSPSSPAIGSRTGGRFVKGGPGGPGRPRGSVNRDLVLEEIRREAVRTRALIVACLKPGALERRIAAMEGELRRQALAVDDRPRPGVQWFVDGLRRLAGLRHVFFRRFKT